MSFDDLFDRKCEVKVWDIIQLFLMGYDDKIYLNLSDSSGNYILTNERIISHEWVQYYESDVRYILDDSSDNDFGFFDTGNLEYR